MRGKEIKVNGSVYGVMNDEYVFIDFRVWMVLKVVQLNLKFKLIVETLILIILIREATSVLGFPGLLAENIIFCNFGFCPLVI